MSWDDDEIMPEDWKGPLVELRELREWKRRALPVLHYLAKQSGKVYIQCPHCLHAEHQPDCPAIVAESLVE